MTRTASTLAALAICLSAADNCPAADAQPLIERVEIGANRAFLVNGQPFFPLMAWLQDPKNFPALKQCGMNTTAGYWNGSGGTSDVAEYLALAEKAGLYGVMPFDPGLKGRPDLLGYIHGDEPDLPHSVSDAEVVPAASLKINRSTPLWKIFDGVTHSWSVLDPLEGASLSVKLKGPVTVEKLVVHLTVSPGLAVAKEVAFEADGRPLAKATLEAKKGPQEIALDRPATLKELKLTVLSTYPDKNEWGSVGEIEGLDANGRNVLLSPPRQEPRAWPEQTLKEYQAIKAADPSRPVFMTLTGYFHPQFQKWTDPERERLYPAYARATDVLGYDIYPIYGWNKPEWIHLVDEATARLVELAAGRPVYAWIETSKGGQWTGPLENQKDVRPEHIRAEVWMAICRGATAVGYFTHVWKPAYSQFGVPEENRRALAEINAQITRLAPVILADRPNQRPKVETAQGVKVDLAARVHGGDLWLMAVNYDERMRPTEATLSVAGLPAGTEIEVIDEGRSIRSAAGSLSDQFKPLAVHIYRVPGLAAASR
jgi:hypothetical protein